MRFAALAIAALGLVLSAGAANAQTFTDPQGRVVFDAPANWRMDNASPADHTFTHLIVGTANNECQVLAFVSANISNIPTRQVFRTAQNDVQFNAQFWTQTANAMGALFPANSATVISNTSEHDHQPWPIQRAELSSPNNTEINPKTIHAALQLRPGLELYVYCMTYGGAEPVATYENVIHSIRHPNDAAWTAELASQNAEHDTAQQQADQAAAAAAAAAAQHPQQQPPQGSRHNAHPSTTSSGSGNNIPPGGM